MGEPVVLGHVVAGGRGLDRANERLMVARVRHPADEPLRTGVLSSNTGSTWPNDQWPNDQWPLIDFILNCLLYHHSI